MRSSIGLAGLFAAALFLSPLAQGADSEHDWVARSPGSETSAQASTIIALAVRYENGEAVARDYPRALALYCDAARLGDGNAYYSLAWMYLNGRGVARNDAVAVSLLRRAAEKGIAQAANLLSLLPNTPPAEDAGCSTAPRLAIAAPPRLRTLIEQTAKDVGIDTQLVAAVIAVESAFNARAVSRRDARGLMQLMPETAARLGVQHPFEEAANVRAGATYLKTLLQQFRGNLTLALAAYNAGEAAIEFYGGVPPYRETRDYIDRVKRLCACDHD